MTRPAARLRRLPCARLVARGRRTSDRGAAAVEFALVAPVLLVLLVGLTEFGRAYTTQASLSEAARLGADAVVHGGSQADARTAARSTAVEPAPTDAEIDVSRSTCLGAPTGAEVTVTVTHRQVFLTGMFGSTLTLTGKATLRCGV